MAESWFRRDAGFALPARFWPVAGGVFASLCLVGLFYFSQSSPSSEGAAFLRWEKSEAPAQTRVQWAKGGAEVGLYSPWVLGELRAENSACQARYEEAAAEEHLPGTPALDKNREELLLHVRGEPVIFEQEPLRDFSTQPGLRADEELLAQTEHPAQVSLRLYERYRKNRAALRQLFLRDGYFYLEHPLQAAEISRKLILKRLFSEPFLEVTRGAETFVAKRDDLGKYRYQSGSRQGQRVRLLLFDRVIPQGEQYAQPRPLHIDLRRVRAQVGFEQFLPEFINLDSVGAELRVGKERARALFQRKGADLELDCFWTEQDDFLKLEEALRQGKERELVLRSLQQAMIEQINIAHPFDEPRTEEGQQDGMLRAEFIRAYFGKKDTYEFNEDEYYVYDRRGRVITPQVCIDYVTETLEYAAGLKWAPRGKPPQRTWGRINFNELFEPSLRRQEESFRQFAKENSEYFSVKSYPEAEWVPFENTRSFFQFIKDERQEMQRGDIIVIRGRAPWDNHSADHTHTFFIYEVDPVTLVPMLISGNAARPRILTWESEMGRTPRRSIRHRLRPNFDWLAENVQVSQQWEEPAVALTAQPN